VWSAWDELEPVGAEPLLAHRLRLGESALYRVAAPAGFAQRRHTHDGHTSVTWVQRGRIEYTVNEESRVLSAGEIVRVEPGVEHEWRVLDDFAGYELHLER
jgi:quercetin dioxygenase-like cupin family protein